MDVPFGKKKYCSECGALCIETPKCKCGRAFYPGQKFCPDCRPFLCDAATFNYWTNTSFARHFGHFAASLISQPASRAMA